MSPEARGALYVGLMSGTSMDGIDAALLRFGERRCVTVATCAFPYPSPLRERLLSASGSADGLGLDEIGRLDTDVGRCFRDAALELLSSSGTDAASVEAIGSHGQTLRHRPRDPAPFSMQIGDPNIIAVGTGITTVADFRRRDVALGGQGAPLAPAFHHWLFADKRASRCVLNVGGIANLTVLPRNGPVTGFDTGPGNTLLDAWIRRHRNSAFDQDGAWASSGNVDDALLTSMLDDPYFGEPPPKTTGFEYFNLDWIERHLGGRDLAPQDVQATLLSLTARSIAAAVSNTVDDVRELFVCGGGVNNKALMRALAASLPGMHVDSTAALGLAPDWVEAAAFAWLASRTLQGKTGNLPSVTGAREAAILGCVYPRGG
jgi:anhydro-N-acetylmuramic acid kinase